MKAVKPADVDTYIASFPKPTQKLLKQVRAAILAAVPEAKESISYSMPYYSLNGRLAYFAGYERHIGFYPMAAPITKFKKEISGYKNGKGSVQFPLDQPIPVELIKKMVRWKATVNKSK